MKESYGEGKANHTGPESCAGGCEVAGEAFDRGTSGLGNEPRNTQLRGADVVHGVRKATSWASQRQKSRNPAGSKTPCTLGNSPHRNWEIPRPTPPSRSGVRVMNPLRTR